MLNNKILLIFSGIAVAAIILVSLYIGNKQRKLSPVINAVPTQASLILETDDFTYLINKISKNENITQVLSDLSITNKFYKDFKYLDSLARYNKKVKHFFDKKTVIISAHLIGQKDLDFLFATGSFNTNKDLDDINNLFLELFPNSKRDMISFGGAEIIKQKLTNKTEVFYTLYEDYLLFSYSEIILQKSIKNINSGASLFSDSNFKSLYEKTNIKNDAKLYLNYNHLFNSSSNFFNNHFKDKTFLLRNFADWTAFDINIKRKEIKLTGHTILKPEMQYLDIFKNANPRKSDILKILPENTSSFLLLNIGSGDDFKYKYEDYLAGIKNLNGHQIKMASFYKKYNINKDEQNLYTFIDDELALIHEDRYKTGKDQNIFCIFEVKDKRTVLDIFNRITENYCTKNKKNSKEFFDLYTDKKGEYKINKLPQSNIPEIHFGVIFQNINAEYYTNINDFIIFGENIDALKGFIDSFIKDKTFKRKSQDYRFIKSLPDESNIFFYTDLYRSEKIIKNILTENMSKKFSNDIKSLFSVQGPAIQFISDSYPIYTTCNISLNSREQQISETIWEVKLDTVIATKPFIILNHNTQEKEVVIQDKANKLYLIDKTGKIIWTRQLDGRIISDIFQIDYYNNNKLQLLFNTKSKIYCIDRIGNWLEGYPVNLKSYATNGISLIDYDKDKNYRIFVATIDKKISLYDKDGNILKGWEFDKTTSNVYGKIKLFQNNDKDYVVFRDYTNIYILNRRGKSRINPEVNIPLSKNTKIFFAPDNMNDKAHFSVSNPSGTIYSIYESGKVEKKEIETQSKDHIFSYYDINGDNVPEYIFTDNNQTIVYNGINDKRLYTYSYDQDIIYDISIFNFGNKDIRLGTGSKNKIYLINNKGNLCEGFPLVGSGQYSITIFDSINEFSLIVGNKDNYLYKYKIK